MWLLKRDNYISDKWPFSKKWKDTGSVQLYTFEDENLTSKVITFRWYGDAIRVNHNNLTGNIILYALCILLIY